MATSYSAGARKAVAEARSHLGYREGPRNNENIFGKRYGWDRVAWCVQFAWSCGDITGSGGGIPKTASTGAAMRWAKSVGRWRTTPQPGDWSIMVNSKGATIHTDLVESYNPAKKQLICIGGNTSGTFNGSVNEGNGVYRNNRWSRWKQGRIVGFVRPFYGLSEIDVRVVQRAAKIKQDGRMGPATVAATRVLQARYGLKADGFPGPATLAAILGTAVSNTINEEDDMFTDADRKQLQDIYAHAQYLDTKTSHVADHVWDQPITLRGGQFEGKRSTPKTKLEWLDHERETGEAAIRADINALAADVDTLTDLVERLLAEIKASQ